MTKRTDAGRRLRAAALAALLPFLQLADACAAPPAFPRVMSIDLCADQLVLALADREQIASVSFLAEDGELSARSDRAAGVPVNRGTLEEILMLRPDILFVGPYWPRDLAATAARHGIRIFRTREAADIDAIKSLWMEGANALGRTARAALLLDKMEDELARLPRPPAGAPPLAAILQANGYTDGPGSLPDLALRLAGFQNLAARDGLGANAHLSLERLIMARPDLLVIASYRLDQPAEAQAALRHPALARAFLPGRRIIMPVRYWTCPGPWIAEAAGRLAGRIGQGPAGTLP